MKVLRLLQMIKQINVFIINAQPEITAGPCSRPGHCRPALTLAELVVVLAILLILATLLVSTLGVHVSDARDTVTRQSLERLRDQLNGIYWPDANALPQPNLAISPGRAWNSKASPQLRYLFVNPQTEDATVQYNPAYRRGWRGPYLVYQASSVYTFNPAAKFTAQYGQAGDPTILDGWGHPIVIQAPGPYPDGSLDVRLVSAGPDGILSIPPDKLTPDLTAADCGDDIWISYVQRQ